MAHRLLLSCLGLVVLCLAGCGSKEPFGGNAKEPSAGGVKEPSADKVADKPTQGVGKELDTAPTVFQDEPAARALYNQMIETMRKTDSLSFTSHLQWEQQGGRWKGDCIYRAWLKKPNYFRIETEVESKVEKDAAPDPGGILIGDGDTEWTYWPQGRFKYPFDDPEAFEKTRLTSYMKKPAPLASHSISHDIRHLVSGMSWPVFDISTFHGYTDSLQPYLDGVKGLGTEKVGTEDCDKMEVRFMKGEQSWYLWISQRDHIPRKLKHVRRVSPEVVVGEDWSSITLNADMPETLFAWKPPDGWTQYQFPPIEAGLIKPGTATPDFELASADGKQIRLSDFRGQVVWFYIWAAD
jgi:outer membrane lipoprotein-sorting protein